MAYTLFTDGGARGNPGPAGAGAVLLDPDGNLTGELKEYLGIKTNNEAEYLALQMGLDMAGRHGVKELNCFLDSELVVKQLNGDYKIRNINLKEIFDNVKKLESRFDSVTYTHVRREKNRRADELVNLAVDDHVSKK